MSDFSEKSDIFCVPTRAFAAFFTAYTKAINKRFGRVGALFQGQFRGKLIQKYEHLLSLCLYNHTNPVKDPLVEALLTAVSPTRMSTA